jgi:tetratricopeptide (TPR) repeat protein
LGNESLGQGRYDEALDRSETGYQAAKVVGARRLELITRINIAWAYYKLGDSEKALEMSLESEKLASQLGDVWNQEDELTNIGYIYMDEGRVDLAEGSFHQALDLAQAINAKEDIYNALRVLARLSLQANDLPNATRYAQRALDIARQDRNRLDELYPLLVQGQIAARRGNTQEAETAFQEVGNDKICPVSLKWESEHSLANLYEEENRPDLADREYQAALATFESARETVRHEDSQLSFLTNAARIYDDYVHFLVARGKPDDALRWADYSRARTLAEGLGLFAKVASTGPSALKPQQIAQRAGGTVLFYWLGQKQSYLWAITQQKTGLFTLPAGAEIDAAVKRYRKALAGPQDVLASADPDGVWLYCTLIAPAQALLAAWPSGSKSHLHCRNCGTAESARFSESAFPEAGAKVLIIPDGSLNNLNFETLLVSEPAISKSGVSDGSAESSVSESKLHYWIEDATIANATSLRVLGAALTEKDIVRNKKKGKLFLIGNSIAPSSEYPELPKAAAQMESVARHFPAAQEEIFAREQATPGAYLGSSPEQFAYIHFVAHGTASRLSPLDSAIVLSKIALVKPASMAMPSTGDAENDSFKLYARDIIRHPLRAELVTISACYGAGGRTYSGEGLVGLSWAFLRAGAHNVVAALWEATDASTEQLMDKFYDEIDKGASPDAALRAAKLSLLRESGFRNPFYWGPFQLYTGS